MINVDKAVKIYKNSKMFDYVVMVEILELKPDKVETSEEITKLYHKDQLVGLNIFDSTLFTTYNDGFIYPEKTVLAELNKYLASKAESLEFTYNKEEYLKVAEVLEVEKIAESDNLSLCTVLVEEKEYSMVCGASNVKEGMKTIAALDNALLSDGTKVTSGKVLNTYSEGMLCSFKELGLKPNQEKSGIIELDEDEEVGQSFFDVDWRKYNVQENS